MANDAADVPADDESSPSFSGKDIFWYAIGAAAALLIVVVLAVASRGRQHPLHGGSQSLEAAQQAASHAFKKKDETLREVSNVLQDLNKSIQQSSPSTRE